MIKEAFDLKQLGIYHVIQPIIDIRANKVMGYELLMRSRKVKQPRLLFSIATEYQCRFEIDMLSVEKALHLVSRLSYRLRDVHVFINVLPTTVNHPVFLAQLEDLTSTLSLSPSRIVFEITEDKKNSDLPTYRSCLSRLKEKGFLIAFDDFGQGDSTIQCVQELKPDIVKLDRYYARGLSESFERKTLITNIMVMLDNHIDLIVEGIERKVDLEAARSLGVRYLQGYYLGRPKRYPYYLTKGC